MTTEEFQLMADLVHEPILLLTADGNCVAANQSLVKIFGPDFVGGRGLNASEIFLEPIAQIREHLKSCAGKGQFIEVGLKLKCAGPKNDLVCEGAGIAISNFPELLIVLRFASRRGTRKRIDDLDDQIDLLNREIGRCRKAEENTQWIRAVVDSSDDAIISKDLNGVIISCNPGASRLFGYAPHELIGQPMLILIPPELQNEETEILARIRRGERIDHFETVRQRKDGRRLNVSLTISPVKNTHGNIIGASKIARDITEQKQSEAKLEASFQREKVAREFAERANSSKDDFLASLSHELRTPLNPVLLIASDAADNSDLSPEIRNNFETIRKNIELEGRLIDDLLDLTRITHGKLSLHTRVTEAHTILNEAIGNIRSAANEKQIQILFPEQFFSAPLYCDDVRLQQVFWNVLKNGVKFTPAKGQIVVETLVKPGWLNISISDTGIGMLPEEVEHIFEAFSQGDHVKNKSHRFGGLGLGLAISRQLVEMHSGRIYARSAGRDQGSTFFIELPLAKVEASKPLLLTAGSVGPRPATNNLHILLVEDHEPTRVALTHLLGRRGYHVLSAGSVGEAREISAKEKLDMVISDIGLPDGNGNDLMKELRGSYGLKGIALTGYGMENDIEQTRTSGFVTHLIKPVNVRALETALELFNFS